MLWKGACTERSYEQSNTDAQSQSLLACQCTVLLHPGDLPAGPGRRGLGVLGEGGVEEEESLAGQPGRHLGRHPLWAGARGDQGMGSKMLEGEGGGGLL